MNRKVGIIIILLLISVGALLLYFVIKSDRAEEQARIEANVAVYLTNCDNTSDSTNLSYCYLDVAVKHKDTSACDKFERDHKQACIAEVAVVRNDKKLCNSIEMQMIKDGCLRRLEN